MPPSKIVAGQSLCTWDPTAATCSLTPPPSNASFTIIVSLLTLLLSVPLIIIIHLLIDNYASRWPGSRGFEDDIAEEMSKEKENKESKEHTGQEDAVAMIWDSACKSEFGEIVKKSVQVNTEAHIEESQMAYAGKPIYLSYMLCSFTNSSYLLETFCLYFLLYFLII